MPTESPSSGPDDRTTSPNAPRRAKTLTGMAILLPALLLGGALWIGSRQPDVPVDTSPPPVLPADPTATPTPVVTPTAGGKTVLLKHYIVFFPDPNGKLIRKEMPMNLPASSRGGTREMWANIALDTLFAQATSSYPPGSRPASPVKADKDVLTVNLTSAFVANSESWSSTETNVRVMSIVNTLAATDEQVTGKPCSVRILIEGKPAPTLGEFDTASPIEPDSALVSKP